jgi:uncharacterized protein
MFTPLYDYNFFGEGVSFVMAFVLGLGFGFTLERAGFGHAMNLAMQFYFRDMRVLKVMFTAIVTALVGIMTLNLVGILDVSMVYINPTYIWPQIAGGAIMGVGFVVGGYCPGTSLVASSTGKIDGMVYVAGAMAGMFVFGEMFPLLENFAASGFQGDRTLADWLSVSPGVAAFLVIVMALGMFYGAELLEKKFAPQKDSAN